MPNAEKKIPFKMLPPIDNAPGHPRALTETYNKIKLFFMPANTTSILQPMDQEAISTFRFHFIRNRFHKATAARDSNSSDRCVTVDLTNSLNLALWSDEFILDQ